MNWKKAAVNVVMVFLCAILQFSVTFLRVYNAVPNWFFCCVVCLAVSESSRIGVVIFSLVAGLITDFMSGMFFGHNAFWFIVISYTAVFLIYKYFSRNFKTAIAVFAVGFVLIKFSYYLLYSLGKENFSFSGALWTDFLPSFLISLPVLAFLYIVYSKLYYQSSDVKLSERVGFRR